VRSPLARAAILATGALLVRSARADDKLQCIAASDQAQAEVHAGHLSAARESLLACARESCPLPVRQVCEKWLDDVQASASTIVVRVTDAAGHDVSDVRVLVDGIVKATELDGRALAIDPGPHLLRIEPRAGSAVEDRLVIAESQKNRIVTETLTSAPAIARAPIVRRRLGVVSWMLGGVGVAGLAGFGVMTAVGSNAYSTCESSTCSSGARSALSVERVVAWSSLGVGLLSGVAAVWVYGASMPTLAPTEQAVSVVPNAGGVSVAWTGRF
jgi:hypothetical protein